MFPLCILGPYLEVAVPYYFLPNSEFNLSDQSLGRHMSNAYHNYLNCQLQEQRGLLDGLGVTICHQQFILP
jgi:hypothetical protein